MEHLQTVNEKVVARFRHQALHTAGAHHTSFSTVAQMGVGIGVVVCGTTVRSLEPFTELVSSQEQFCSRESAWVLTSETLLRALLVKKEGRVTGRGEFSIRNAGGDGDSAFASPLHLDCTVFLVSWGFFSHETYPAA